DARGPRGDRGRSDGHDVRSVDSLDGLDQRAGVRDLRGNLAIAGARDGAAGVAELLGDADRGHRALRDDGEAGGVQSRARRVSRQDQVLTSAPGCSDAGTLTAA